MIDFEALFLELYADKAADQDQAALGLLSSPSRSSPTTTTSASSSSSAVSPSSSSSSPSDNPSKKRRRSRRRRRRGRRAAQEGDRYRAEGETSDQPVIKEEEEARDNMGLKLSKYIQKATATNGAAGGQKSNCCDHDRPGSPPRRLASILRSESLSDGFRIYLRELDEEEDDDVTTRVVWLDFVLACREVRELQQQNPGGKKAVIKPAVLSLGRRFFSRDSKVSLGNLALWNECQKLCSSSNKRLGDKNPDLSVLWRAHDTVVTKLDEIHEPFLLQQLNNSGSVLAEAKQCLLSIL